MIRKEISQIVKDAAASIGIEFQPTISFSAKPEVADFQCNDAFKLAKTYHSTPLELAQRIVDAVGHNEDFAVSALAPGFINFVLTDKKLTALAEQFIKSELGGVQKREKSQKIVLDYGGANIAKELHVGHLRPAIIGEALKRLYRLLGDEVISDVHLGDFGLQMGLNELQLYEDGNLDYYFGKSDKKVPITIEMLDEAYPKASKRKKEDEAFAQEAEDWTLKIQKKISPYYEIYLEIKQVSLSKIKESYHKLGADFDLWLGESDCAEYAQETINIIKNKGITRVSEGALVVDVAREGENSPMPPCIIAKSNGGILYATTDLAGIYMRNLMFKPDRIEYVTDLRQKMHFEQVFRVSKMAGISPEGQQLIHIPHGTMNGYDGKPFKTRSGDTLKLEDIIKLLVDKATERLKGNGVNADPSLALKIGVGAMKFGDLINTVSKDYVFDLDKFMSFEGKTGPYLQYTVVRINSILAKANEEGGKIAIFSEDERAILIQILKLISTYDICYNEKSLSPLCQGAFDLACVFSRFYNNHTVLGEKDDAKRKSYLSLLALTKLHLTQALFTLGIEVPEKM